LRATSSSIPISKVWLAMMARARAWSSGLERPGSARYSRLMDKAPAWCGRIPATYPRSARRASAETGPNQVVETGGSPGL
jgi:hypothetical protein